MSVERIIWSLEKSLKDLQLDYLDLWYLHWPVAILPPESPEDRFPKKPISDSKVNLLSVWRAMRNKYAKVKLKHLGYARYNIE